MTPEDLNPQPAEISGQEPEHRLLLTPFQQAILRQLLTVETSKKIEERFDNLTDDQRVIRRHIFLDGGIEMLHYILHLDKMLDEQKEQEKAKLLEQQKEAFFASPTPETF